MNVKQKFIDAGNNGFIDGWTDEEIDIRSFDLEELEFSLPFTKKGSFKEKFYNKDLVVSNCPSLKKLDLQGLKLTGLKIENCPELETLNFSYNNIKNFDLTGLNKLENLYCSGNELTKLDLTVLKECEKECIVNEETGEKYTKTAIHLRNLTCNDNSIKKLEVKHLKELESLYCFCCELDRLDCRGLENLKDLNCASNVDLDDLKLKNCKVIEILDCAETSLEYLSINNHPNLKVISMRESNLKLLAIRNCDNLEYLDISNQQDCIGLYDTKLSVLNSLSSLKTFYLDRLTLINDKDSFDWGIDFGKFPKLELLEIGEVKLLKNKKGNDEYCYVAKESSEFEEYLAKKRQEAEQQEDEGYCSNEENKQIPGSERYNSEGENQEWLNKWLQLKAKKNKKYFNNLEKIKNDLKSLDLSWQKLKGKLVIKNYPKLQSLNLGNNKLNEIVIVNCPELVRLIVSHNPLIKPVKKLKCPKLQRVYYFSDSSQANFTNEFIEDEEDDQDLGQDRLDLDDETENEAEVPNDKINHDITLEYLESLTYEELLELDVDSVPADLINNAMSLLTSKFKEEQQVEKEQEQEQQEIETNQKVSDLITKAQQALEKKELKQLKVILTKLKIYADTSVYEENKNLISNLEQELKQELSKYTQRQQLNANNNEPINFSINISISLLLSVWMVILIGKILQPKIKKCLKTINL